MKFIARRWWLYQGWKIGENEQYLSDMAKKGFHFLRFNKFYTVFEEGEPKDIRYVIKKLPYKTKLPEQEISTYRNKGWEYVEQGEAYTYIFREIEVGKGQRLYRSEQEIEYTIKGEKRNIFIFLLIVVIRVQKDIMQYSSYIKEEGMVYAINHIDNINSILLLIILPILIIRSLSIIYRVKNDEELVSIDRQNYQSKGKRKGIFAFILCILLPLGISLFIINQEVYKTETFDRTTFSYPVVFLEEIETDPNFIIRQEKEANYSLSYLKNSQKVPKCMEGFNKKKEYNYYNHVTYRRYLLAPKRYSLMQEGYIPYGKWIEGKDGERRRLEVEYYYLTFPEMADALVEDLIDKYENRYTSQLKEMKDTDLDKIFIGKEDDRQRIYITKGREVFFIEYMGCEEVKRIINLLKQSNHFNDI